MILCTEELASRIDKAVFPFTQGGPLMHVVAAKAVALKEAASPAFVDYAREAEERCDAARITLNKNAIPYDPQKPMTASGIRVGTPSVTTQGMREAQMREIAGLIARAVRADPSTEAGRKRLDEIAEEVGSLVATFRPYGR